LLNVDRPHLDKLRGCLSSAQQQFVPS
jgi:hypothetical protein